MASQTFDDSYTLFRESSDEWDAPFKGKQPSSYPQSPEEPETQQSHQNSAPRYNSERIHESSLSEPSTTRAHKLSNSRKDKPARRQWSKAWYLHKVKNERTLLQTDELLQQLKHLEKSLKPKPTKNSPDRPKKGKDAPFDESKGSSSVRIVRNEPCHKRLGDSDIIPRPKKDPLIQKLEEMEQQFLAEEKVRAPSKDSKPLDSTERFDLEEWKESVKERAKRNAIAASRRPLACTTTENKPATYPAQKSPGTPVAIMKQLKFRRASIGGHGANTISSLASYTLPSPRCASTPVTPTDMSQNKDSQRTPVANDKSRRISLGSYTLPSTDFRIRYPSPRSKLLPMSPRVEAPAPKIVSVMPRPPLLPSPQNLHEGEEMLPDSSDKRGQVADCKSPLSSQQSPSCEEKTDEKVTQRTTSFRRTLVPMQQDHQKFSEKGLQAIREARQKRLQLLLQRQQDAQATYLAEQRKRIARLSGSPAKAATITTSSNNHWSK